MKPDFQRFLTQASRLTQSGRLAEATAAIQAALARRHTAPAPAEACPAGDVVDVVAREVFAPAAGAPAQPAAVPVAARTPAAETAADARGAPGAGTGTTPNGGAGAAAAGRFVAGSHSEKAGSREFKLYIPPAAKPGAPPLPLVVMLHGCTQNPDDFAAGTGMNELARDQGLFVLYPAQAQNANPSRCWNWFKHNHQQRDRGEPAILAGMVRALIARHAIDPARVYVAGLSAGGAMAAILGDAYPDLFAAVGVHSGLATGSARDAASAFAAMRSGGSAARAGHAPPTIVFHGDQDATVHPANGQTVAVAARGGAAATETGAGTPTTAGAARAGNGRRSTRQTWRDAQGRVVGEHWLVHGAGHAWAGGSARGSYTDPQGPDASAEMLRFFGAHALKP